MRERSGGRAPPGLSRYLRPILSSPGIVTVYRLSGAIAAFAAQARTVTGFSVTIDEVCFPTF